jgi:hypothetical protein
MTAAVLVLPLLLAQEAAAPDAAPPPPPIPMPPPPAAEPAPRRRRASDPTLLAPAPLALPAPPPMPPMRPIDPAALRLLWASDPPVDALRHAATALAQAEPAHARALIQRARWAAVLPETRVRIDRRFNRAESVDLGKSPLDGPATPVGVDSNNDVRYEWRATWDLSRIIFNPDELGAESQALRVADVRREIEGRVIRLYFERRRLKAEALATDATDTVAALRLELRIEEMEAELDALTGGAFTRLQARRGGAPSFAAP